MSTFEEHYTVSQLSKMWGLSTNTVARRLRPYLHLIPDFSKKSRSRFGPLKRPHSTLRIPKSVAERIYRELIGEKPV